MSGASPVSLVDRVLGGRYRLIREIASGGMGTVWRAEHLGLKKPIAVKLINADYAAQAKALARLEREAQVLARLEHPHAVRVYDFAVDAGQPYLAMELIEGVTLESVITKGLPRIELTVSLLLQILEVLEVAHANGIIHRDLKPANIMLTGPNHDFVKVVDFGIAALAEKTGDSRLTEAGNVVGTAQYMSPEQIRAEPLDGRSDLYSLGCVAFEALTGRLVFTSRSSADVFAAHLYRRPDPLRLLVPEREIPAALEEWVLKLLQKDAVSRFATANDASAALRDSLTQATARGQQAGRPTAPAPEQAALLPFGSAAVCIVHDGTIANEYDMLRNALAISGATEVSPEMAEVLVICAARAEEALTVARRLLSEHPNTPVLICSTDDAVERFAEAVAMGVHDFIALPLEPSTAVKRVLSARRKGARK